MAVWDLNSNLDVFGMQTFISDTGSPEPLVNLLTLSFFRTIMVVMTRSKFKRSKNYTNN
jgi:hypothetical protein